MSLVNTDSGEVFVLLDETEARILTDRIRTAVQNVWALLEEAHERRAWSALGYRTFEQYVKAEFDMARSRAYQLLDQASVIHELSDAVSPYGDTDERVSTMVDISERDARDLKPHLDEVTEAVRTRTKGVAPERVQEIVAEVVRTERERIVERREANAAIAELNALAPPGFDAEADKAQMVMVGRIFTAVTRLVEAPPPAEVIAAIRPTSAYQLDELPAAVEWLNRFAELWEAR